MPCTSAVPATGSTAITAPRPETSRPGVVDWVRPRKGLEVFFARRTFSPGGMAASLARSFSTASSCATQPPGCSSRASRPSPIRNQAVVFPTVPTATFFSAPRTVISPTLTTRGETVPERYLAHGSGGGKREAESLKPALEDLGDPVVVIAGRDHVRSGLDLFLCVAH